MVFFLGGRKWVEEQKREGKRGERSRLSKVLAGESAGG